MKNVQTSTEITMPVIGKGATVTEFKNRKAFEVVWVSEDGITAIIERYVPKKVKGKIVYEVLLKDIDPFFVELHEGNWCQKFVKSFRYTEDGKYTTKDLEEPIYKKMDIVFGVLNESYTRSI